MPARKPAAILFVAAFAAFLATFNEAFLNVGFAPIMESLLVDVSTVQALGTGMLIPIGMNITLEIAPPESAMQHLGMHAVWHHAYPLVARAFFCGVLAFQKTQFTAPVKDFWQGLFALGDSLSKPFGGTLARGTAL